MGIGTSCSMFSNLQPSHNLSGNEGKFMNSIHIKKIFVPLFLYLFYCVAALSTHIDLFSAIKNGDQKSIEKLLTHIKHPREIFNREGQTPLYIAAEMGNKNIVMLLLEHGFSPNEANETSNRLSRQFALSTTNPSHIGFVNKETLSPRKRSVSSISHYEAQKFNRTPIFSLLKDNITKNDIEIALILLEYKAQLDIRNSEGKSPVDTLVEQLFSLSKTHHKIYRSNSDGHKRAKDFFMRSLPDPDKLEKLVSSWHLFANSAITADILDSIDNSQKSSLKNFLPLLIHWKLDSDVPSPDQALEIFQKSSKFLDDKQKLLMLMTYLYSWSAKTQITNFQQKVINFIHPDALLQYKANRVAEAIFYIDKEDFLTLPLHTMLMKFSRGEINPQLENFLARINSLKNFVALSIVTAKSEKKMLRFWQKVSIRLEELGDFFALQAVRPGIGSLSVERLIRTEDALSKTTDVSHFKQYSPAKAKRARSGFIPSIIIEGGQFKKYFEDATYDELFSESDLSLDSNSARLLLEFEQAREALTATIDQARDLDHNLRDFFRNLPLEEGTSELFSLRRHHEHSKLEALNNYFAENWDTREFFWWWKTYEPKITIHELSELNIIDGPSLIESYAFHKAYPNEKKSDSLRHLFEKYELYCIGKAAMPLGRPQVEIFEDALMVYSQSSFHWIMWLRNHGLQAEIPALLADGIVNFEAFIEWKLRKGLFSSFAIESVNILENLFQIYELSQKLPPLNEWGQRHLESWLFSKGLNHLTPLIFKDTKKKLNRFLAYGYFLKHNPGQGELLPNSNNWIYKVFDCVHHEFNVDDLMASGTIKRSKNSYLYFIATLITLKMEKRLVNFYRKNIHSVSELKEFLKRDNIENLDLLDDEVLALKNLLDKKAARR